MSYLPSQAQVDSGRRRMSCPATVAPQLSVISSKQPERLMALPERHACSRQLKTCRSQLPLEVTESEQLHAAMVDSVEVLRQRSGRSRCHSLPGDQLAITLLTLTTAVAEQGTEHAVGCQVSAPPLPLQPIRELSSHVQAMPLRDSQVEEENPYEIIDSDCNDVDLCMRAFAAVSSSPIYESIEEDVVEVAVVESNLDEDAPPSVFPLVANRSWSVEEGKVNQIKNQRSASLCEALLPSHHQRETSREVTRIFTLQRPRVRDIDYPRNRRRKSFDLLEGGSISLAGPNSCLRSAEHCARRGSLPADVSSLSKSADFSVADGYMADIDDVEVNGSDELSETGSGSKRHSIYRAQKDSLTALGVCSTRRSARCVEVARQHARLSEGNLMDLDSINRGSSNFESPADHCSLRCGGVTMEAAKGRLMRQLSTVELANNRTKDVSLLRKTLSSNCINSLQPSSDCEVCYSEVIGNGSTNTPQRSIGAVSYENLSGKLHHYSSMENLAEPDLHGSGEGRWAASGNIMNTLSSETRRNSGVVEVKQRRESTGHRPFARILSFMRSMSFTDVNSNKPNMMRRRSILTKSSEDILEELARNRQASIPARRLRSLDQSLHRRGPALLRSRGVSTPNIMALPDFNDTFVNLDDDVFSEEIDSTSSCLNLASVRTAHLSRESQACPNSTASRATFRIDSDSDSGLSPHTAGKSSDAVDSSYDRAVEEDRRGSVPSVTVTRPVFSLSPSEEASDKASISSSYSETKPTRKGSGLKSQFIRRARSITKLDKKRGGTSASLSSKTSGSVQDMSGWSYVNPSLSLPAQSSPSSSLSSSTLPSYRCATTNSTAVMVGGDGSTDARTPVNGTVLGRLKRSLSLTRLTKKRSRSRISQTATDDESQDITSPRSEHRSLKVQSARSCESLLVAGSRIPSVDLGEGHIQVVPLHRSMLGEDNCIQLTSTSGSSTFYSCRNSEERSQWLNHLRKTVNPGEEQMRRSDVSVKVWIQEAKNCPNKKRYYCEIALDKALYARTSTKQRADMLFWGELFDFDNLPSIKSLTVSLHREGDKKKKRDKHTQVGYVTVPISDLQNRQIYEKWHTLSPATLVNKSGRDAKTELPQIRLKVRYQTVEILPLASYNSLVKYLKTNYQGLVERLEPLLSVRAKDDVACSLVHILQREQLSRRFLCDIVISEVPKHENLNLMLRGNTVATKAIEAYMKLIGNKYLHDTLEDFVRLILDSEDSCEVDPGKLQNNSMLQRNQCNLISYCEMVWGRIINSHGYFPSELRDVFTSFRRQCEQMKKGEVSDNLISACIFLRFICPAIMSPSLFGLCQELPEERQSRNFTLVAKTLQSLANFTKFGSKEDYMSFMNEFVEREWNQMQNFLKQISTADHGYPLTQFEGYIDCGKHLSLLHSQLVESVPSQSADDAGKFSDLQPILSDLSAELEKTSSNSQTTTQEDRPGSISSQQSNLTVPKSSRPESDEYVELCQDRIPNLSHLQMEAPQSSLPSIGRQLNISSSKDIGTAGGQHTLPHYTPSHQQRPSLTVGQDNSAVTSQQVTTLARLPDRPKDPDADISNRSDSDTMKSTSSNGSRKIVRHRVWDRVLTANDLVNGDYIDLISYMDDTSSPPSLTTEQPQSTELIAPAEVGGSRLPVDGEGSKSLPSQAGQSDEPPAGTLNLASLRKAKPSNLQPNKEQPLAFVNPAFKHSTSMLTSPRRGSENHGAPEFTPLPNKFNSLNLRGRNKKAADSVTEVASPRSLRQFHHRDPPLVSKPHIASSTLDLPASHDDPLLDTKHLLKPVKPATSDPDSHRDEKRYGCARFPTMELYPETSVRPQPDGSSTAYDLPLSHQSTEQLCAGDRPNTPTSNLSWAGSQVSLNSQQTGIKNLQKSIDETSKIKQEYEAEVTVLRTQLTEAQARLNGTESRLAYQAEQTNEVMGEWKVRLDESEERLKAQQHEKDEQIKNIIQRLLAIEEDLRQEQQEMKSAISRKEAIIESQERRIRELDSANNKLHKTLSDMKEKMGGKPSGTSQPNKGASTTGPDTNNRMYKTTLYVTDYHKTNSSFC